MNNAGVAERRLRIALLVDRFGRKFGGAESYGLELFSILAQRHDVTVIAHDFDHDLPVREIRIHSSHHWPSWIRVCHYAWQARKHVQSGFDIVHSHMNAGVGHVQVAHVIPVQYRKLVGKRWHQRVSKWLEPSTAAYLLLERASFAKRSAHCVVAVSPMIRQQLVDCGVSQETIPVIPPGVHLQKSDAIIRRQIRAQLGWSDKIVGCLMVARNPLRKGLKTLLEALERMPHDVQLLVVGAEQDLRNKLGKIPSGVMQRVVLQPPVTDVNPFYQAADVFVHPTLNDSFGMAPLEAMAHGLPVVMSGERYCGFAKYCEDDQNALLMDDPKDAQALARAIEDVIGDPQRRSRLIMQGRALAASMSWDQVAKEYESLYADLIIR